jgi:PAS domain S-box-containing protein
MIDLFTISNSILYVYVLNIGLFSWAYFSNRTGRFESSKIILLYTILISIYLFGSNNLQNTETYLLYFPLVLLAFAVNGYGGRYFSVSFSIVTMLLYFLDAYTSLSLFPQVILTSAGLRMMSTVNFIISFTGLVYISYFLTTTHFLSEKSLIIRQKKLNKLTNDLRSSQQRYKLAMIGTNAGLWDWDLTQNRIYHSPKWKEMLGYSEGEFDNVEIKDIYALIHQEDIERVKKAVQDHLEDHIPYEIEYRIRKQDGGYDWFYDSGKALVDEHNKPVRMVGSILNITKRKSAEDKIIKQKNLLEKANAELDRFVYITSHDLKAPLLSIQGLIHLAEISEDKSEVELCMKMMMERIKGLQSFIADVIDYSRNVKVGLVSEEIDLRKMIETIYKDLFFLDNIDNIDFKIDVEDNFKFNSDDKRINVILKNLILNAIKYRDTDQKKPYIIVSAKEDGNHLIISVKDNGVGIDPEIHEKIYDMFFRASEKSSGSGLGLYIVKEMVDKLGGSIELISSPGIGSEFTLHLPVNI